MVAQKVGAFVFRPGFVMQLFAVAHIVNDCFVFRPGL